MRQALEATAQDSSGCPYLPHELALSPPMVRFLNSYATRVQTVEPGNEQRDDACTSPTTKASGLSSQSSSGLLSMGKSTAEYDPTRAQPLVLRGIVGSAELYARLSAEYPLPNASGGLIERTLLQQLASAPRGGGLVGGPDNFQVWYDSPLMALILARSPAWRLFDKYLNSPEFLSAAIEAFGPQLLPHNPELRRAADLLGPARQQHVWHSEMENHEADLYRRKRQALFNQTVVDPSQLYTIWSFQAQRCPSVGKGPHRDRENRLFSLVIYFSDASGWRGGEFVMYNGQSAHQGELEGVALMARPENNLGVLFLCRARSIHRVSDVYGCSQGYTRTTDNWRRAVYVSVARRVASWDTVAHGPGAKNWEGKVPP